MIWFSPDRGSSYAVYGWANGGISHEMIQDQDIIFKPSNDTVHYWGFGAVYVRFNPSILTS